jgi:hypothetical protein
MMSRHFTVRKMLRMGISRHTVHSHCVRLYEKANVSNRLQLVAQILGAFVYSCKRGM